MMIDKPQTTHETPEEKAKRLGVPLVPKIVPRPPNGDTGTVAICGECGLELQRVMGYCCPRANCPTGLGGTICQINQ